MGGSQGLGNFSEPARVNHPVLDSGTTYELSEDRDYAGCLHLLCPEGPAMSKEGTGKPLRVYRGGQEGCLKMTVMLVVQGTRRTACGSP